MQSRSVLNPLANTLMLYAVGLSEVWINTTTGQCICKSYVDLCMENLNLWQRSSQSPFLSLFVITAATSAIWVHLVSSLNWKESWTCIFLVTHMPTPPVTLSFCVIWATIHKSNCFPRTCWKGIALKMECTFTWIYGLQTCFWHLR